MTGWMLRSFCLTTLTVAGAHAQAPMEVMSDTPGYCAQLEAQVSVAMASIPVPAEIRALAEAGHRMCREGEIRAGITRFRLALIGLHGGHARLSEPSRP